MARSTMAALIQEVRQLTYAGTAEYTLGTAAYWDDTQVNLILDKHRREIYQEPLIDYPQLNPGGVLQWFEYRSRYDHWEATDGGTAIQWIERAEGTNAGTSEYTADYLRGIWTFGTPVTAGSAYMATGRIYDVYGASAELLRSWATRLARQYAFSSDGQTFNRQQAVDNLLKTAATCEAKAWAVTVKMVRDDISIQSDLSQGRGTRNERWERRHGG